MSERDPRLGDVVDDYFPRCRLDPVFVQSGCQVHPPEQGHEPDDGNDNNQLNQC